MSCEDDIKKGKIERLSWLGHTLHLYWEVWADAEVKPCFIVELSGKKYTKDWYATLDEADAAFDKIKRDHAVEIAVRALGLKLDTVKNPQTTNLLNRRPK